MFYLSWIVGSLLALAALVIFRLLRGTRLSSAAKIDQAKLRMMAGPIIQQLLDSRLLSEEATQKAHTWLEEASLDGSSEPDLLDAARTLMEGARNDHEASTVSGMSTDLSQGIKSWLTTEQHTVARRQQLFSFDRIFLAIIAGFALALVFNFIWASQDTYEVPAELPTPPIATQAPFIPTTLQVVENGLGPFKVVTGSGSASKAASSAVLLLGEDGSTKASTAWKVAIDPKVWSDKGSFWIRGVQVNDDHVVFKTATDKIFGAGVNQPFVLGAAPDSVICVDATGTVHTVSLAQAIRLREPLAQLSK